MKLLILLNDAGTHAEVSAADQASAVPHGWRGGVIAPDEVYRGIPYDTWRLYAGRTVNLPALTGTPAPEPAPDIALGDVLDTAFQLIRRGALPVLAVTVLLHLPPFLLAPASVGTGPTMGMVLWMAASATWTGLTQAVLIHLLSQAYGGSRPDLRLTVSVVAGRAATVVGVAFVAGGLVMLGTMAFLLPGIYLMCRYYVVNAVAVLEYTRPWPALGRSAALIEGAAWKVLGAVVTLVVLSYLVRFGVAGLYRAQGPLALLVTAADFVVNAFLTLLTAAVATSFYYALRVAKEGYDLEQMADRLNADEPAPASA